MLRHRNAALFLAISTVSGFGGTALSLTAGVWVMSLTGSGSLAALAGVCVYLPSVAGPLLGAVVDRLPRRPLLIWTCLLTALALLALLAVRSPGQFWLIYLVMLVYGISYVLVDAGEAAVLPSALPADLLGRVNGLRMSAQEGVKLIAPLAGAALFTWIGGPAVAVLSATALACAAALYAMVRVGPRPRGRRPGSLLREAGDGLRFLRSHRRLRAVVAAAAITVTLSGVASAALYPMVVEGLGRPAAFAGVLASGQGLGSVLGGTLVGRILRRRTVATLGGWGALVYAVGPALQCLPWTPAALAGSLLIGVGLPWTVVAAMTAVQLWTPEALLGRVASTASTVVFAPVALALAAGAGLLALADYRVPLSTAVAGACLSGAWLLRRHARDAGVPRDASVVATVYQ